MDIRRLSVIASIVVSSSVLRFRPILGLSLALTLVGCTQKTTERTSENRKRISEPPSQSAPTGRPRLRTVYVAAYSHLPGSDRRKHLLSILLSIRNVDSSAIVTLTHVDYFDTSGHRVRRYLASPRKLRPLETAEFTVETVDDVGGSGANFLIYWEGPSDAHPLLTESVMWGHLGAGYVSFASRGIELDRRPDGAAFETDGPPASSARSDGEAKPEVLPAGSAAPTPSE